MRIHEAVSCIMILFLLIFFGACQNANVNLDSREIPDATDTQITAWEKTNNFLLGIRGDDPVDNRPQIQIQDNTWELLEPEKKNLGGIFNRYAAVKEGDQIDWNFLIHIFDEYMPFYNLAVENPSSSKEEWFGCIDPENQLCSCLKEDYNDNPCLWAEIAPDINLVNHNAWFQRASNHCQEGAYLKRNDTIGVYGYPVTDDEHGYNPEIHPAQQVWFRNKTKSSRKSNFYWLMFIQDASERFQGWVESPIYGQFLIAFRIKPFNIGMYEPHTINIKIEAKEDLITNQFFEYATDADNGTVHNLIVNHTNLLKVNEPNDRNTDDDLGVKFIEVTKLVDGTIQGYVQISMVLGDLDTDPIGHCILELEIIPPKRIIPPIKQ